MEYKVTDTQLSSIADAIRTKGGTSSPMSFPDGFVDAIGDISGGTAVLESLSVSANGHYTPSAGVDGFNDIVVNVSGGGGGSNDNFLIAVGAMSGSIYDTEASMCRERVFADNRSITGVTMTAASWIGSSAFGYAIYLSTAVFPSCETIYYAAFSNCGLASLSFPVCKTIGENAFLGNSSALKSVYFPECETIGSFAFRKCAALSSVSFPKCETIYTGAFSECQALTSAEFPLCTSLGQSAFKGCYALETAILPMCASVGGSAFEGCIKLAQISLPNCSVISTNAFSGCSSLASVYLLSTAVVSLASTTAFAYTPISNSSYLGYFGSIYVPSSLVDAYKTASRWSTYSDRITAYTE